MLISEKVKLKWNSRIHKHYVDLGYKYTKMGDEFDVNVNDLTHGSRAIVKCICDYCGNEYSLEWQSYYRLKQKQNKTDCCGNKKCTTKKSQESLQLLYDVCNPRELDWVNEKIKKTNLERYGVENVFSNEEVKEKIKQYWLTNYGVEYSMQVPEIQQSVIDTCLDMYGVKYMLETVPILRGEDNPNWKGDLVKHERTERNSHEYRLWRKSVFERDHFVCQCCNGDSDIRYIEAHHIYNWGKYTDKRFDVDNGVTLCKKCHISFHSIYGKKDNTQKQLDEFINNYNNIDKKIC